MGVYARFCSDGHATFVIINPARDVQLQLRRAKEHVSHTIGFRSLITLILSCASANWRTYVTELEEEFIQLVSVLAWLLCCDTHEMTEIESK
jgi:hypothetical protein